MCMGKCTCWTLLWVRNLAALHLGRMAGLNEACWLWSELQSCKCTASPHWESYGAHAYAHMQTVSY